MAVEHYRNLKTIDNLRTYYNEGGGGTSASLAVSITYSELKTLRNGGNLNPGTLYRITDYVTKVNCDYVDSAEHVFDIIVLALDNSHLSEEAWAAQHSGDTYFSSSNLSAWKLWYCLDNDSNRFNWVAPDSSGGKGVIFRMIDEFNNDAPFDFKNLLFQRWAITGVTGQDDTYFLNIIYRTNGDNNYLKMSSHAYSFSIGNVEFLVDSNNYTWYYLFSYSEHDYGNIESVVDATVNSRVRGNTYNNKIGVSHYGGGSLALPEGVFIFDYSKCVKNVEIGKDSFGWTCCRGCDGLKIGDGCQDWMCGNGCHDCKCGNGCSNWVADGYCYGWKCGNGCSNWVCQYECTYWSCGNYCSDWKCGNYCSYWSCGNHCSSWSCGNDCSDWKCGNYSSCWSCGNYCSNWSCGNDCYNWKCGNYCSNWSGGNDCYNWACGTSMTSLKNYMHNFHLENGVKYVYLNCTATTSSTSPGKNILVHSGVLGTSSAYKTCTISTANNDYLTEFGTVQQGTVS